MAKKYTIPYAHLFKQIKAANLQCPSGYWTELVRGRPTEKPKLPVSADVLIRFYEIPPGTREKKRVTQERVNGLTETEAKKNPRASELVGTSQGDL